MCFNQVQTFLLHRVFKDLDKSLFETDFPMVSETETGSKSIPYEYRVFSPNAAILKNQIAVYNTIIERIKKLPVTEKNFEILVYIFEYRYLHLQDCELSRRDVIDIIQYVVDSCAQPVDVSTLIETMEPLLDPSVTSILDDFVWFVRYFPYLTKYSLGHVIAITYGYECLWYPFLDDKLASIRDFGRHSCYRYIHRPEGTLLEILEEIQRFCDEHHQGEEEYYTNFILDEITSAELSTDVLLNYLQVFEAEYKRRLKE